jgi:hypothetical protein
MYEDKMKYGGAMDTFNHGKADIVNCIVKDKKNLPRNLRRLARILMKRNVNPVRYAIIPSSNDVCQNYIVRMSLL